MLTTQVKYTHGTNFVATNYKKNSDNFFMSTPKSNKQYKTMNQLLKECPLLGSSSHGLNYIA